MNNLQLELKEIFKISALKASRTRILFSFLSTTIPLIAGYFSGKLIPFIIATLLGHFLFLSDTPKPLLKRIKNLFIHAILFLGCILSGIVLHDFKIEFIILFCIGVYILAISVNVSKELEMSVLLCLINLILGFYSSFLSADMIPQILLFNCM